MVFDVRFSLALIGLVLGCARSSSVTDTTTPAPPAASAAPANARQIEARIADASPDAPSEPGDAASSDGVVDADASIDGMLLVPGGTFTMGADRGGEEDEHPAHTVTLAPFYLDRSEVTNQAYGECVRRQACNAPDANASRANHAGPDAQFRRPRQPVMGVSWSDGSAYCRFVDKRLPREAEWEKAARDSDDRRFPWGNDAPTPEHAAFGRPLGGGATDDVGAHPAGRGAYGHDDLAGNVWEWMSDEYDPFAYKRSTANKGEPGTCKEILAAQDELRRDGKQGYTGSNPIPDVCEHVLRGGAFNYDGPGLRVWNRVHHPGTFRLVMAGFRCARDAR